MAYPYDATDLAALTRLASFYNGNAYNASTNAGGMAAGGHRINFIPALQDLSRVGTAVEDAADAAATSAAAAAVSDTAAAASAAKLSGTSTTSVPIGTGAKSFTTQASKFFNVGTNVIAVSAANPTTHYMEGQVTFYDLGTGALTINATVSAGSGSRADWSLYVAGAPGVAGATGATGSQGATPALKWNYGNGVSDSDPGNGIFLINNATYSAATFLYFDNLDASSVTATTFLDALDDSTTSANRGTLFLQEVGTSGTYAMFTVTGAVVDGTGYRKVQVTHIMSNGAFTVGNPVAVSFQRTGNAGSDGVGAGDTISDVNGNAGRIALYTGTAKHITEATVGIGTSGANVGVLNANNTHSGTMAFTGTVAYSSTLIGTVANANALTVGRQGSTNPALQVDTATASCVTGFKLTSAAAAGGLALAVISSGTDENLTINAKGAGTITLNGTGTGLIALARNTTVAGTVTVTSASASAMTVGLNGATNPSLQVDASTGSSATGLKIKSAAAAAALALSVISSGTNENLTIDAKGTGTIALNSIATGQVLSPAGTVSLPGMAINGDPNTGIYGLSADVLAFSTGGTGRVRIDSASLAPVTGDGLALGTSTNSWSDASFASGAVIGFNSAAYTITHSAGLLTFSHDLAFAGSAWSTTSPTITATSGAFTTVSGAVRYKQFGKTVCFTAKVVITTAGSAAGSIVIPLPVAPLTTQGHVVIGNETLLTGLACQGTFGATDIFIVKYDGTTIIASGRTVVVTGIYEAA